MIGIRDAGSVDMDASSRNTTGKSTTRRALHDEVTQVVQIYGARGIKVSDKSPRPRS